MLEGENLCCLLSKIAFIILITYTFLKPPNWLFKIIHFNIFISLKLKIVEGFKIKWVPYAIVLLQDQPRSLLTPLQTNEIQLIS